MDWLTTARLAGRSGLSWPERTDDGSACRRRPEADGAASGDPLGRYWRLEERARRGLVSPRASRPSPPASGVQVSRDGSVVQSFRRSPSVRLHSDRGAAAGGHHLAGTTPTRPARRRSCPVLGKAAPLPVAPPLAGRLCRVHARPGPVPGQPHCTGHDPSRPSSRAHAHLRSGPERRSKAPEEEGGLGTTTTIRRPEPRHRSTRPRQAAAELDHEAGHRCRGSTTGPANPPTPRASPVTRSPYAAAPQPADEREAAIGHGRDGL